MRHRLQRFINRQNRQTQGPNEGRLAPRLPSCKDCGTLYIAFSAFSALTLLAGRQEEHPTC